MEALYRSALALLSLSLLTGSSAAAIPSRLWADRAGVLKQDAPLCGSCQWLVKSLKCELSDVDTQDQIIRMIIKDVCSQLPADSQEACSQLAPSLIPVAIMYIQSLSSSELCADALLCGPSPLRSGKQRLAIAQPNDFNCPMCKMVLIGIKQELRNPESEKAVIERAHQACAQLPTDWQAPCIAYIDQFGEQVFEYIEQLDPTTVCMQMGACPPALAYVNVTVPPLPPVLVAKAAALRMRMHDVSATNDLCGTCKQVILDAAAILGNLDTQKQILEYAKQACQAFGPNFKDQCLNYVELYGPLVVNMIVQYLKPEVCIELGYCPKPSLADGLSGTIRAF